MAGQTRTDLRVGGGMLAAGVLLAAGIAGCTTSVRDADVVLSGVRFATVVGRDGARHPARDGARLARGDRVETAARGVATLTVRDRHVLLREHSAVTVPDGASVALERGSILVDRRRGPGLVVRAGDARIDRVAPGAVRIDRGFGVQLAVYLGGVRVRTTSGRSLAVPALHQTAVSGRSLPGAPAPLVLLAGDDWERALVPAVVELDAALVRLARGIDAEWGQPGRVVPAAFADVTAGGRPSETVLRRAIGEAAARSGAEGDPFAAATRLRVAGGSWGVVAALLDADVAGVSQALGDLMRGVPPSPVPGRPDVPGGPPIVPPSGGTSSGPGPSPTGTRTPGPTPTGSPTASPSPTSPIDEILDDLERQLPSPTPTPTLIRLVDLGLGAGLA